MSAPAASPTPAPVVSKPAYGRENNFDLIRLIAAWSVIVTHGLVMAGYPTRLDPLSRITNGRFVLSDWAVYTFFIISGYLITASAMRAKSLTDYARNRFLRIWPGLAVCVLFCVLVLGPVFSDLPVIKYLANPETRRYLLTLTVFRIELYLPGVFRHQPYDVVNGSLWTLGYEAFCYIVVAGLSLLSLLKRRWLAPVLVLTWLVAHMYVQKYGMPPKVRYIFMYTSVYLDDLIRLWGYFMAGIVAYLAVHSGFKFKPWMGWLALVGLFGWWHGVNFASDRGYSGIWFLFHPKMPMQYLFLPIITFWLAFAPAPNWLRHPLGRGRDWSYGIYIYGMPVQQMVMALLPAGFSLWGYQAICLLAVLPFAALSWEFIEGPALKLKGGKRSRE